MVPYIMGKHIKFQYQVKYLRIDLTNSEVLWLNNNHVVEGDIGHLKKHFRKKNGVQESSKASLVLRSSPSIWYLD